MIYLQCDIVEIEDIMARRLTFVSLVIQGSPRTCRYMALSVSYLFRCIGYQLNLVMQFNFFLNFGLEITIQMSKSREI